jgi:glycine/D-amino acid oxidase-like deaminating enzyme
VVELSADGEGVTVRGEHATYRAEHVIVTTGAYANPLLDSLGVTLDVELYEMTTAHFRAVDPSYDYPTWFAFQEPTEQDTNLFYGFGRLPWATGDLVRVCPDFEVNAFHEPHQARHAADPVHVRRTADWVAAHLPALDPTPVRPGSCLIALPGDPERQFYLGHAPGEPRIVVHSAGWGFKYIPLFGRALVELALDGGTTSDLSRFAFS